MARRLIARAEAWLSDRQAGIATVLAPMQGDAWRDYRAMVEGHDLPPFLGEPRNPASLPGRLRAYGFEPFSEHWTKTLDAPERSLARWEPFRQRALRRGIRFEAVAADRLDGALDRAHALGLRVFSDLELFSPLPWTEFRALYAGLLSALAAGLGRGPEPSGRGSAAHPETAWLRFALDSDGQDLGLAFAFRMPGQAEDLYLKSFGILPAWRGTGLAPAFLAEIYRAWLAAGVRRVHHCLMGQGEASARFDRGAGRVTRRYQLFARPLAPTRGDGR